MYYPAIGALAFMILCIENHDIIFRHQKDIENKAWGVYRNLLWAVLFFYTTDIIWGLFDSLKHQKILFWDTQLYFFAMALCVLFWTQYVITYMDETSIFGRIFVYSGRIFCLSLTTIVIINSFTHILFWVDEQGVYHTTPVRFLMLIVQIVLLDLLSLFAIFAAIRRKGQTVRKRYRTIVWFGLITSIFLFVQLCFPLVPLYTIAYLLGTCLLRTFVVNDEKEEYKRELEKSLQREKEQLDELKSTRFVAYRDALTGVKSKSAYVEIEKQKNEEIQQGKAGAFSIAVFDLNDLKVINDTFGHETGDEYIKNACRIICQKFKHSPVFRVGGDEFVALLEREDYENREDIAKTFNEIMDNQKDEDAVVVAMGMSDYIIGSDASFNDVFIRADKRMYKRKRELKKEH